MRTKQTRFKGIILLSLSYSLLFFTSNSPLSLLEIFSSILSPIPKSQTPSNNSLKTKKTKEKNLHFAINSFVIVAKRTLKHFRHIKVILLGRSRLFPSLPLSHTSPFLSPRRSSSSSGWSPWSLLFPSRRIFFFFFFFFFRFLVF